MAPRPPPPSLPPPPSPTSPGGGDDGGRACVLAREALLAAEPTELETPVPRGHGVEPAREEPGTTLARHLETCASCREAAGRLLAASSRLDGWLASPGRGPDVEGILSAVDAGTERTVTHGGGERPAIDREGERPVIDAEGGRATPDGAMERGATDGDRERATTGRGTGGTAAGGDRRTRGRWRRTLPWALPAAAAAGLVGLLVLGSDRAVPGGAPDPEAPPPGPRLALHGGEPDLDLEVPPDTDAAVLATGDPDITVIWFLGGDR